MLDLPRPRRALLAALSSLALVAAAGCGSDDDDTAPPATSAADVPVTTATAPATTTTSAAEDTPPQPDDDAGGEAADPAGDPAATAGARERLEAAGYAVRQSQVAAVRPRPRAALELALDGGGDLTIYAYDRPADARAKAAELRPLARQGGPEYVRLTVDGATVYFALVQEEGERLDQDEVDRVIAAAQD